MADDTKKRKTDDSPQETKSSADESPSKKSGMHMVLPFMIVSILIGLGGLGAGGFFLYTHAQAANAASEQDGAEKPEITETDIYFKDFPEGIVNLATTEDCPFTYLKFSFSLEVENEKVLEELATKLPRLTSKVATVMSNRTWAEISSADGRDQLSREAVAAINGELKEGRVIGLYFTTFVAQ